MAAVLHLLAFGMVWKSEAWHGVDAAVVQSVKCRTARAWVKNGFFMTNEAIVLDE